jgi:hypothetical protein
LKRTQFALFVFLLTFTRPCLAQLNGDGLLAVYYDSPNLTSAAVTEVDPNIAFYWGTCAPESGMPVSGYSVKWTGLIEPTFSEPYTFVTDGPGGVSVIVNGTAVISSWVDGPYRGINGTAIALTAGVKVPLEVDYFFGGAVTNYSTIQLAWRSPSQPNAIIQRPFLFTGNPLLPTPTPQTAEACQSSPTVDGVLSEWAWNSAASWNTANKTVLGNTYGSNARFNTLWDSNNLYIGVTVTDSQLTYSGPLPYPWDGSMVEVDLDTTDSRTVTVNSTDFVFGFPWNGTAPWEVKGRTTGVTYVTTTLPTGYVVEAAIPWTLLGITPGAGTVMGFDVGLDVNHNGGVCRDGQLMWNGGSDNYGTAGAYGSLVLAPACPTPIATPPAPPGGNPYVAPNPSNGNTVEFVYTMGESGNAKIKVWNAWGNLVASLSDAKAAGLGSSRLNVAAFAPGHYFYRVELDYDSGRSDIFKTQVLAVQK